jgi:hypothetical protein
MFMSFSAIGPLGSLLGFKVCIGTLDTPTSGAGHRSQVEQKSGYLFIPNIIFHTQKVGVIHNLLRKNIYILIFNHPYHCSEKGNPKVNKYSVLKVSQQGGSACDTSHWASFVDIGGCRLHL